MATRDGTFTIVQISDLHCGAQFFLPNLLERAITEVNDLEPQIVVVSGDLTTYGFKEEYAQAKEYLAGIDCQAVVVTRDLTPELADTRPQLLAREVNLPEPGLRGYDASSSWYRSARRSMSRL